MKLAIAAILAGSAAAFAPSTIGPASTALRMETTTEETAAATTEEPAIAEPVVAAVQTINGWGFDVEVLYIAQRHELPIVEIPVNWYYGEDSRVSPIRKATTVPGRVPRVAARPSRAARARTRRSCAAATPRSVCRAT